MRWKVDHRKLFWILLVLTAGIIVINGMTTDVSLGDESHHYHFAQNIYEAGKRVAFSSLYESGNSPGFYYNTPPFWHLILAFLWKITGGISQAVAQAYHILFFVLLVWVVSLLTREVSGEEGRWLSALIMTTVPMVVSFSTLFYMDIPMTAMTTLSLYFIWKRRYMEAGVASGLAYFTKLNSVFFFPGFFLLIVWKERRRFWPLLKGLVFFIIPILIIYLYDSNWRKSNITSQLNTIGWSNISIRLSMAGTGMRWREYLNSYLTNPLDIVKYFGFAFLFLLFFHFFRFRRWDLKGRILWVPVISYLILFIILFGIVTDIRYLIPIVPFLIALLTPSLVSLGKKWKIVIVILCLIQFMSTSIYVYQQRQISPEIKEGFEYIKKNVPVDANILYPEENLLIYAERRVVWGAVLFSRYEKKLGLDLLFWGKSTNEMNGILQYARVSHILIKKSRIYDDTNVHHSGGYPRSFVERLPHLEGWMKISENQEVSLWRRELQPK
ncbi:MAG: glycosyltransferase family 39 protein [Thermodesulfobacteriota bacterium]|nr:glycosyltransferase family 39 protein [Thermodesulfobacteriota bacterium]